MGENKQVMIIANKFSYFELEFKKLRANSIGRIGMKVIKKMKDTFLTKHN